MSALAATPDQAAAAVPAATATTPVNSSAADELEQYYAEIEGRDDGDDAPPDVAAATAAAPTTATATTTTPDAATATATTPPAPPPVGTPSVWDEIDNDPELPKELQGKTHREIYDANKKSRWQAMQAGQQKNDAVRELNVAQAMLKTFQAIQPTPTPAPIAPPAPPPGHEVFGFATPEEAFGKVDQMAAQIPQLIERRAAEIADQRMAPLAQKVAQMETTDVIRAAESARLAVRDQLKLDPAGYEAAAPALKAYLYNNKLDPRYTQNWEAAVLDLRSTMSRLSPPPTPTAVLAAAPAPPVGSATSAASAPATPQKFVSTGDRKADAMISHQLVTFFNLTKGTPKYEERFKQAVQSYREDRRGA